MESSTDIIYMITTRPPTIVPATPQKNNNNKRKTPSAPTQPNKKFKSDDEIINLLMQNNDSSDSDPEDKEKLECNNPLCDHKDFTAAELKNKNVQKQQFRDVNTIDDLIDLGKLFHCKKNTMYFDINLRLLCNLVEPLTKLKNMVGMKNVKTNMVNQIVFFLQGFNRKEKCNECLDCIYGLTCSKGLNDDMLHTVITGSPGTGKTELGKILGQVYKAMGILSKGHFISATRTDLIGKYLGHTASKTQAMIDKARGGVLFIDEAYALGNSDLRDSFSKECIDTINQNLSERRDFLCIIAGYADQIEKCFFQYNEGLKRRFTYRYDITGYTSDELMEIFLMKVYQGNWKIEFDICDDVKSIKSNIVGKEQMKSQVKDFFRKNKNSFPNYGGDIETLLLNCKVVHGKRVMHLDNKHKKIFTLLDITEGFKEFIKNRKSKSNEQNDTDIQMIYNIK